MSMRGSSRLPGFYSLSREQRLQVLEAAAGVDLDAGALGDLDDGGFQLFDRFIENAIGGFPLPLGVAVNFRIDGRDVLVPMAVEESSVVAAASNMARRVRNTGGFTTEVLEDLMIGQIELRDVDDAAMAADVLRAAEDEILALATSGDPGLREHGGGIRGIEVRPFEQERCVVVHLLVHTVDAMGANAINTICEAVAPTLADRIGATVGLRILSNLADRRRFAATCRVKPADLATEDVPGEAVAEGVVAATRFAAFDPYRAATHNKGIMNGVDPIVIATGNDWRAVEAGAHAWAARTGRYGPLSSWTLGADGLLHGRLEMPIQVGVVGGVTRLHPVARFSLRLLHTTSSQALARVMVAVGLAQNLAALRPHATAGLQRGHMRLHQRNLDLARENGE